ncbi:MAG: sugar ABC transporter permease YjfF [Clostridia bacterium]|nr:sugar ABC transporter permease YjfF [Clostridia bacterium]
MENRSRDLRRREPLTDAQLLMTITICIFIGLYILAMAVWGGGFLRPQQLFDLFNNNAALIVIACGMTVVMITGGIDLSVGAVVSLVVMVSVINIEDQGGNAFTAFMLGLAIGAAFGIVQGLLIAKLDIQPFIVTLSGMFFARGVTTMVSLEPRSVQDEGFSAMQDARIEIDWLGYETNKGAHIPGRIEWGVMIAIAVVIVIFVVLRWARFGRDLYAVGGNEQSALMLGINVSSTRFWAYVLSGVLSGIGGFVFLLHTGAGNATNAAGAEMTCIAAAIMGGTLLTGGVGNVIGTMFGVLTIVLIRAIVVASGLREPWWQSITTGAMLCFFIILQSLVVQYRGRPHKDKDAKKAKI